MSEEEFNQWMTDREGYFNETLFLKNYSIFDVQAAFDYKEAQRD